VDFKCPNECNYYAHTPQEDEALFPSCKVDSRTELHEFMYLTIDRWIHQPMLKLDGRTAREIARKDQEEMLSFLLQYQIPASFPLDYLLKRLNITTHAPLPGIDDPESVAGRFFDLVISRRWDDLSAFYTENTILPNAGKYIAEILQNIPALNKCRSATVINCGLSEDQITAYVYLELNGKTDWTMVLRKVDDKWQVKQNLLGTPQDYFAQNDLFTQVATDMAQGEFEKAESVLYRFKDTYPDTADIHYYYGVYHQWAKQNAKAEQAFTRAVALESNWAMPLLHLGLLYMADRKFEQALTMFREADRIEPDNPVVLNNLGACYYGRGELNQAREAWNQAVALQPDFTPVRQNLELLDRDV